MKYFLVFLFFTFMNPTLSWAVQVKSELTGPIQAQVLRVVDGDSFDVAAKVWIDQVIRIRVRIAGIDAPEIHGKCEDEITRAKTAKIVLSTLLAEKEVILKNIKYGKYAGRVLADVETQDGLNVADYLVQQSLARSYHGKKRESWCR